MTALIRALLLSVIGLLAYRAAQRNDWPRLTFWLTIFAVGLASAVALRIAGM